MPSMAHEALALLFASPALTEHVLRFELGLDLPAFSDARLASADLSDLAPRERRADRLVVFSHHDTPRLAVIIEAQLRPDNDKAFAWPDYLVGARSRFRCPACVLVVTLDEPTAAWSARPIDLGPGGSVIRPLVLGPGGVPLIVEPEAACACPELAVLSAMAHGKSEEGPRVARATFIALAGLEPERGALYADLVLSCLSNAARKAVEELMDSGGYRIQSDWALRHFAEGETKGKAEGEIKGKAEGKATAVLAVLEARGLAISDELRRQVLAETDLATLDAWIRRAAVVGSAAEVVPPDA